MTSVVLLACLAFSAVGFALPPQTPAKGPLRVFVETDEIGGDLAARRTSVTDLTASLATKKKQFLVVESEDKADVLVEVLDRTVDTPKVVIGIGARPGQPPGPAGSPARSVRLRASVKYTGETTILTNKNSPLENNRGWKSAADDLAKQIEQWITARSKNRN